MPGYLILIDGPSGVGKSSLTKKLAQSLRALRFFVAEFSEDAADNRRGQIVEARLSGANDYQLADLFTQHRMEIYQRVVFPALENFDFVILDRGEPSTMVYQTMRKEMTIEEVFNQHRLHEIKIPDLIVILVCQPEMASFRKESEGQVRQEREAGNNLKGKFTKDSETQRVICRQYCEVFEFLKSRTNAILIENDNLSIDQEVSLILKKISKNGNHLPK